MSVSLSAIIPTVARDLDRLTLLRRSILSGLHQLREGDEIIVAGDTRDGSLDDVHALCARLALEAPEGTSLRYVAHDGGRMSYGHDQINHAMSVARGDYLTFNDDDDVYAAGAFDAMRTHADAQPSPRPMLFRFLTHFGLVVWLAPGVAEKGMIGGHCICTPNLPSLLGYWGEPEGYEGPRPYYEGDWTFVQTTLEKWAKVGVAPVFVDRLIAVARPPVRQL